MRIADPVEDREAENGSRLVPVVLDHAPLHCYRVCHFPGFDRQAPAGHGRAPEVQPDFLAGLCSTSVPDITGNGSFESMATSPCIIDQPVCPVFPDEPFMTMVFLENYLQ